MLFLLFSPSNYDIVDIKYFTYYENSKTKNNLVNNQNILELTGGTSALLLKENIVEFSNILQRNFESSSVRVEYYPISLLIYENFYPSNIVQQKSKNQAKHQVSQPKSYNLFGEKDSTDRLNQLRLNRVNLQSQQKNQQLPNFILEKNQISSLDDSNNLGSEAFQNLRKSNSINLSESDNLIAKNKNLEDFQIEINLNLRDSG